MSAQRGLIVVDIETTGLDVHSASLLEVAAINVLTGDELYFVPDVTINASDPASWEALRINRYFERGVFRDRLTAQETVEHFSHLRNMLVDNTLAGCNPTFDGEFIARCYWSIAASARIGHVWHHRLADLAAYAAGALNIPPNELIGLSAICERLGVTNEEEHSALGDARATAECFRKLMRLYEVREDS